MISALTRIESLTRCVPLAGTAHSGDAAVVIDRGDDVILALIDATGRSAEAEAAVRVVEGVVRRQADNHPASVFEPAHRALGGGGGVSLGIVRIDPDRGELQFAGIGSVYGFVAGDVPAVLTSEPGTVGLGLPKVPTVRTLPWPRGGALALAADGVVDVWELAALWRHRHSPLESMIERIAGGLGRLPEDASVILARAR
ncbi:MAG: SpoIIE family protein phosphatase [Gemmatimonadales bacterium]|nr:SpoIIE family protein phosphatase [Gemmatimonadales bacterium]